MDPVPGRQESGLVAEASLILANHLSFTPTEQMLLRGRLVLGVEPSDGQSQL
jgi:hypothetical protein